MHMMTSAHSVHQQKCSPNINLPVFLFSALAAYAQVLAGILLPAGTTRRDNVSDVYVNECRTAGAS